MGQLVYLQKNSRRKNHRFERPELQVAVNGATGKSINWSLGGVAVAEVSGDRAHLAMDATVSGALIHGASDQRFDFEARVARIDDRKDVVALEFSKLSRGAVMMFIQEFRQMIGTSA